MNIIVVVSDTLRRDFLGCYGNEWIHTEHLDAFAKKSLVFDKAYIASFPTMPNRADVFTGKYTFNYLGWAPLPANEVLLAEVLRNAKYNTKAVVDLPVGMFFVGGGYNYNRGFIDYENVRGQGQERLDINLQRRYETDYCAPATMLAASRWLERHYKEKFFLYVDTWDPHEPWDPPRWYADMYYPKGGNDTQSFDTMTENAELRKIVMEGKGTPAKMTEDELKRLRALYAGEVTMVDRWVGMLLQKIEDLGLFENTAVIFTTDHGSYHGEHNYISKRAHIYEEVGRIPLIIRSPGSEGTMRGRCDALVQPPDLMPTILELVGVQIPETVQGKSLIPIIRGEEKQIREIALSSQSLLQANRITVTSNNWSLIAVSADSPQTDISGRKVEPELYYLQRDPKQTCNLFNEKKEVAEELHSKMIQFLKSIGTREDLLLKWRPKDK